MTNKNLVPPAGGNPVAGQELIDELLHEIAGTTHVVFGYADLLEISLVDEESRAHLHAIKAAVTRLHDLSRLRVEASPLAGADQPIASTRPRRLVLHVEDDLATQALVKAVLGSADIEVHGVSNLADAQLFLDSNSPDLLIVDHRLGEESGLELLQFVRASEPLENLPAIVMSGESSLEIVQAAEALGAMVLEKPVANDQLIDAVSGVLQLGGEIVDEQ